MFKELRSNLFSSRVFLLPVLISFLLFSLIIMLLVKDVDTSITLIVVLIILTVTLMNFTGRKRRSEISTLLDVIKKLRMNQIHKEEDISLPVSMQVVEKEIKEMYIINRANIEYLKKLERVRTEFIANTSHELRTPIFAIQGFIETLLNGALEDPNVNKLFLEKANRHTHNLNNLLNDLIDISMIESGEMRMHFRYFNVIEYFEAIIEEYRAAADKKSLYLRFIHPDKNLSLFGDKEKIRLVLNNLIQNAIKYTDLGGIEVIIEEEPKFGKITVKDTGIGIPEDAINRVFERFYRIDKGRSKDIGGTGLGLAIVKHIIEAHNSKIEVKSTLNEGTEFSFRLKK